MKLGRCDTCDTLREVLEIERKRFDELTEKYHALRVQGANPQDEKKGLTPASRPSKPADVAIDTVVERFNGNVALRRRLMTYVLRERSKPDADEEKIADRVLHWRSDDDEEAA